MNCGRNARKNSAVLTFKASPRMPSLNDPGIDGAKTCKLKK
jgi:hypothetical protein